MDDDGSPVKIGVVGVCGSGKSTLVAAMSRLGIRIHHIAQEHSYVPYMWQRITNPDLLIYLDASYPVTMQRRKLNWLPEEYQEQRRRLQHAFDHANLYIDTDPLSPEQVQEKVLAFLRVHGVHWQD